jgi:hypothetical protein
LLVEWVARKGIGPTSIHGDAIGLFVVVVVGVFVVVREVINKLLFRVTLFVCVRRKSANSQLMVKKKVRKTRALVTEKQAQRTMSQLSRVSIW